ncbi:type I-C CRISPR-associated protein Cas8c/Csd1 [Nocardia sp. NPDC003482]
MTVLAALAARGRATRGEVPRFYRKRQFPFSLDLNLDGTVASFGKTPTDHEQTDAPALKRTSSVSPILGGDDVQYLFGGGGRAEALRAASLSMARRWRAFAPNDPVAAAVAAFFESDIDAAVVDSAVAPKHQVRVTVGGRPVWESPTAAAFWASEVADRKGAGVDGFCMVCARTGVALTGSMPDGVSPGLIPGATNSVTVVQIDDPAASPICLECADDMTVGLQAVLWREGGTICAPGSDSRIAWWITDTRGEVVDPMRALSGDLDEAERDDLLRPHHPVGRFHALTVSATKSRLMIRDWIDTDLASVRASIARWLRDADTAWRHPEYEFRPFAVTTLVAAHGHWDRHQRRYREQPPAPAYTQRQLLHAILHDAPIPATLTAHLIKRIKADGMSGGARLALIQAATARTPARA